MSWRSFSPAIQLGDRRRSGQNQLHAPVVELVDERDEAARLVLERAVEARHVRYEHGLIQARQLDVVVLAARAVADLREVEPDHAVGGAAIVDLADRRARARRRGRLRRARSRRRTRRAARRQRRRSASGTRPRARARASDSPPSRPRAALPCARAAARSSAEIAGVAARRDTAARARCSTWPRASRRARTARRTGCRGSSRRRCP